MIASSLSSDSIVLFTVISVVKEGQTRHKLKYVRMVSQL